jgi:hypothetical protein
VGIFVLQGGEDVKESTDRRWRAGALVGVETVLGGLTVHLFNSALFETLFAAAFDRSLFDDLRPDVGGCLALGVVHSALLGAITGGLLLPAAVALAGATSLPVPTLPLPGLTASFEFGAVIAVAHLIYGLVLGRVFAALTLPTRRSGGSRSTRSTGRRRGERSVPRPAREPRPSRPPDATTFASPRRTPV